MKTDEIKESQKTKIRTILEDSNFNNPIIITTKYGFTKFWKDETILFSSWGDNWNDKTPSLVDIDFAIEMIIKSKFSNKPEKK